jgi:hypothetical protein
MVTNLVWSHTRIKNCFVDMYVINRYGSAADVLDKRRYVSQYKRSDHSFRIEQEQPLVHTLC